MTPGRCPMYMVLLQVAARRARAPGDAGSAVTTVGDGHERLRPPAFPSAAGSAALPPSNDASAFRKPAGDSKGGQLHVP